MKSCSCNASAVEINYKVLLRWYTVPTRLVHVSPDSSAHCFNGCSDTGSLIHIWWIFISVYHIFHVLFHLALSINPCGALLNWKPEGISNSQFALRPTSSRLQNKLYRRPGYFRISLYLRLNPKSNETWLMKKLTAWLHCTIPKFHQVWDPLILTYLLQDFDHCLLVLWWLSSQCHRTYGPWNPSTYSSPLFSTSLCFLLFPLFSSTWHPPVACTVVICVYVYYATVHLYLMFVLILLWGYSICTFLCLFFLI